MTRILVRLAIIILGTASILLVGSLFWFGRDTAPPGPPPGASNGQDPVAEAAQGGLDAASSQAPAAGSRPAIC